MATSNRPRAGTLPGPDADPLPPWPGQEVQLGGQWVFVRRAGRAGREPALFVHGLGGASSNWTDLMALLAPRTDGRAIDLPGFGLSPPPSDGHYPLSVHVRAVEQYIRHWNAGPVHLFGNSLGGAVSTRLAAERPDLVKTLTLVSPALPHLRARTRLDSRMPLMLVPGIGRLMQSRMAGMAPATRVASTFDLVYADPSRVHPLRRQQAEAEVMRRAGLDYVPAAFAGSLRGLVRAWLDRGPANLWRQAAAVNAPVLVIWGREDRLVDVAIAEKAHARLRDSRLVILAGVGHAAQMEAPLQTAAAVIEFLDDVAAGRPARQP